MTADRPFFNFPHFLGCPFLRIGSLRRVLPFFCEHGKDFRTTEGACFSHLVQEPGVLSVLVPSYFSLYFFLMLLEL